MIEIKRGRITRPQRVVIYAPEGLGKSTIASQLAKPLFLDFENGTCNLDVARIKPAHLGEVESALIELARNPQGFETLVIDTADWLEELVIAQVLLDGKKPSIEAFGYGKGWVMVAERFNGLLKLLDDCAKKMNVLVLAHSHVKRMELPDTPAFDHYELKLSKQVGPLLREWCDALLFGNWKTIVKVDDNERAKATNRSGKERVLRCQHSSIADAKNRHGLSEEEPWGLPTLAKIFAPIETTAQPTPAKPEEPKPAPKPAPETVDEIPGNEPINSEWARLCWPIEQEVNAFLLGGGRIKPGQTWRDVGADYAARAVGNPIRFVEAVRGRKA